ncbi:hypothetical protein BWI96_17300 [Siphonobacter sp. SORGH_AS_0500]|uniref:PQQ-dependent sugar dehydrogenase n=1 Tax=Siphonobacter sp. SORGH_AS_0500 TaxID=1864824 RepID=UPI000CC35E0E|nr:PQQ-dependent sugar dehydrogenase [Siphonobacter sp. SORGH_AS_0500]PKK35292.1 hypothetical protein BWI96_17300 [Siphonobacter sp. SORGH_AS_0500]
MLRSFVTLGLCLSLSCGYVACQSTDGALTEKPLPVHIQLISDQLLYPTAFAVPGDGSGRLFVTEQVGRIRVIEKNKLNPTPFLDISSMVIKRDGYDERGLLGLAFHPQFSKNGKFYVYYSAKTSGRGNHKSVIEEFTSNQKTADPKSGKVVLEFDEPESNHNGGDLKFGPDGMLYIAVGDGGGAGDKHGEHGNGQNMNTLLGKILRIDVNQSPYGIPQDNPFKNKPDVRPEIFAYGLRNPWRISFDQGTGKLFAGDVGQNQYEEVDIITKGGNYGWRVREGYHTYNEKDPDPKNYIDPITEYSHSEGISITGGFVYRGNKIGALKGKYIFADWSGPTWYLSESQGKTWPRGSLQLRNRPANWQVYSFGEDEDKELYILGVNTENNKGFLYKLTP